MSSDIIDFFAAALSRQLVQAFRGPRVRLALEPFDPLEPTENPPLDDGANRSSRGIAAAGLTDGQHTLPAARGIDHPLGRWGIQRQRLLAENMQPSFQGSHNRGLVQVMRKRQYDGIQARQAIRVLVERFERAFETNRRLRQRIQLIK